MCHLWVCCCCCCVCYSQFHLMNSCNSCDTLPKSFAYFLPSFDRWNLFAYICCWIYYVQMVWREVGRRDVVGKTWKLNALVEHNCRKFIGKALHTCPKSQCLKLREMDSYAKITWPGLWVGIYFANKGWLGQQQPQQCAADYKGSALVCICRTNKSFFAKEQNFGQWSRCSASNGNEFSFQLNS